MFLDYRCSFRSKRKQREAPDLLPAGRNHHVAVSTSQLTRICTVVMTNRVLSNFGLLNIGSDVRAVFSLGTRARVLSSTTSLGSDPSSHPCILPSLSPEEHPTLVKAPRFCKSVSVFQSTIAVSFDRSGRIPEGPTVASATTASVTQNQPPDNQSMMH